MIRGEFRSWRLLPAAAWAAVIWFLSATPDDGSTWLNTSWSDVPMLDKVAHAGMFGLLAALLVFARLTPIAAVAIVAALGVVDEIHQSFVPGRMPDPWDVVADVGGAIVVVAAVRWLAARRESAGYRERSKRRSEP